MTTVRSDAFLAHYGVPGMRWGKRKSSSGDSGKTTSKAPKSEDHETARALMKKSPSQMSNSDLKKLNERLQLERSYTELMAKQGSSVGRGRTYVRNTLDVTKTVGDVAKLVTTTYNVATSPAVRTAYSRAREAINS